MPPYPFTQTPLYMLTLVPRITVPINLRLAIINDYYADRLVTAFIWIYRLVKRTLDPLVPRSTTSRINQQRKSVLNQSTCWCFASIRKLALNSIKLPAPHDRLILVRTYAIDQTVLPAFTALCERAGPLGPHRGLPDAY